MSDKEKLMFEVKPNEEHVSPQLEVEKCLTQISEATSHETAIDFKGENLDLTQKAVMSIREPGKLPLLSDVMVVEKKEDIPTRMRMKRSEEGN